MASSFLKIFNNLVISNQRAVTLYLLYLGYISNLFFFNINKIAKQQ